MAETVLVVDDDPFMYEYFKAVLGSDYRVLHAADGSVCLQTISDLHPDVVLLDVHMPGMDGYEVCRAVREDAAFDDLAIVFVSARCEPEDRLHAYDAGANYFLTKPVAPAELQHRVAAVLKSRAETRQLKASAAEAFSVAMSAMGDAAVFGQIVSMFRALFAARNEEEIMQAVLPVLKDSSLQATVQIRQKHHTYTRDVDGRSSSMEEVMLKHMSTVDSRISEFGARMVFVYEPVSILVKNAPQDEAQRGKLRDYLAFVAEGAAERVKSLVAASSKALLEHTEEVLRKIESEYRAQQTATNTAFSVMMQEFEDALLYLGLHANQEESLIGILQTAMLHARDSQTHGLQIDAYLQELMQRFTAD